MGSILGDFRLAVRVLARRPGFFLAGVATLALGIGAVTSIFTLLNALLLRPPAEIEAPEQLVAVYTSDHSGPAYGFTSFADLVDFRAAPAFASVAAYLPRVGTVGDDAARAAIGIDFVTTDYFHVLGVRPAEGRFFAADTGDLIGRDEDGVVISAALRRRLGDALTIPGGTVRVNGAAVPVLGVAPPAFRSLLRGRSVDVWAPLSLVSQLSGGAAVDEHQRGDRGLLVIARLADGARVQAARTQLATTAERLRAEHPDQWTDVNDRTRQVAVIPESAARIPPQFRGAVLGFGSVLGVTAGLLLLICCWNVACLMLGRATGRAREVGVRLSLGASRGRIARQLLTEASVMAAAGGAAGVLLAAWAVDLALGVPLPVPIPVGLDAPVDARVLGFALLTTAATTLLAGLAPALRGSRADVRGALMGDGGAVRVGGRRWSLRSGLVVAQVALSSLLLSGGLVLVRGARGALTLTPGFATERLLLVDVVPPDGSAGIDVAGVALAVRDRVAALRGVESASWADAAPLSLVGNRRGTRIEGHARAPGEDTEFHFVAAGPAYLRTLGVPLLAGRDFTPADRADAEGVVIVNETFARRFWSGRDPLDGRVSVSGPEGPWLRVVGVARDTKQVSLGEPPRPFFYVSALQEPRDVVLHVRTEGDPLAIGAAVRQAIVAAAPGWAARNVRTFERHAAASLLPQRIAAGSLSGAGTIALLLAAVGLYGVVTLSVAQRMHEMGVRMALGADRAALTRLVLAGGMRLATIGIFAGMALAFALTRLLGFLLVGAAATDAAAFAAASACLAAATMLACWVPARRAARLDPLAALRME